MTDQTSLIEFPCQFPIKVMGNAHPALKAVADHICPPAGEDGIWHALHDLGVLAD